MGKKMSKKMAISLVLLVEVLVYLFLFVGVPALENFTACPECNAMELPSARPFLYFIPGLVGLVMILGIWKQKKEVEDE